MTVPQIALAKITDLLAPFVFSQSSRSALLASIYFNEPRLRHNIDYEGASHLFVQNLIQQLLEFGELEPGVSALTLLLDALSPILPPEQLQLLTDLIAQVTSKSYTTVPAPKEPDANRETHVFVSFSKKDWAKVHRLVSLLEDAGLRTFTEMMQTTSANFEYSIKSQIESSSAVLLVASRNAENSQWIQKELEIARSSNRKLVVVSVDPAVDANAIAGSQDVEVINLQDDYFQYGVNQILAQFGVLRGEARKITMGDASTYNEASSASECYSTRFSAFYPRTARISHRYPFLVYIHLPDAIDAIIRDAESYKDKFGSNVPPLKSSKVSACLQPETPVTVVIECKEQEFEPLALTKKWRAPYTRFDFEFSPDARCVGDTIVANISIRAYNVEIARIENCAIEVMDEQFGQAIPVELETNPLAQAKLLSRSSEMYNRIFVSYAREDTEIVEDYRLAQLAAGNVVFMDTYSIRSGQNWERALAEFIDQADVFQLFWSEHSANSENVRYEWDYALKTRCSQADCRDFIRPVYWKKPLVDPPDALQKYRINFAYVPFALSGKTLEWRLYNDEFWERIEAYFQESNVILKRSVRDLKRGQRAIYRRLDQTHTNDLNAIVESLQRNELQQQEMNEILASVQQILRVVQTHSAQVDLRTREALEDLTEAVESSLGLQQKLELALPVIPFFLDYKVELAAGSDVDLNKVWDDIKARWARLVERVRGKSSGQ